LILDVIGSPNVSRSPYATRSLNVTGSGSDIVNEIGSDNGDGSLDDIGNVAT
jgi:hypothetical protein